MRRQTNLPWVLGIFLLSAFFWSAPSLAQDDKTPDAFREGQSLLQNEKYAEATAQFQKCVEADKDFGDAWFFLGYALHMDGKYEAAIKAHKRAAEFKGEQFQNVAMYNLACAQALTGKSPEAQATLEKSVAAGFDDADKIFSDPDLFSLHPTSSFAKFVAKINGDEKLAEQLDAGQTAVNEEDFDKAAEIYRAIVEINPKNDFAAYRLGFALHGAGKLDEAIKYHEKATTFPGTKGIGFYNWGCALSLKGEKPEAIKKLEAAVENGFVRLDAYENDPDLNNVREETAFKTLVEKIQKRPATKQPAQPDDEHEMQHAAPALNTPFALGVKMGVDPETRVIIEEVIAGSAAERDGLRAGDEIVKVGDKEIGEDPIAILRPYLESGDKIIFEINRDGETKKIEVKPNRR